MLLKCEQHVRRIEDIDTAVAKSSNKELIIQVYWNNLLEDWSRQSNSLKSLKTETYFPKK